MWQGSIMSAVMLIAVLAAPVRADTHAGPEPVRLGLVDLSIEEHDFSDLPGVTVRAMPAAVPATRRAVRQSLEHRRPHGVEMVRAVVAAFRAIDAATPVAIHVASPFRVDARTGRLALSLDELERSYMWFAEQGVVVIAQTFVAPDSAGQRAAIGMARRLGLVILASAGNGPSHNAVPPYPAAYDGVIAISTTALSAELSREADRDAYVDFSVAPKRFTAIDYRRDPDLASLQGSSAATASAMGILGALSLRWHVADRDDAMALLGCLARPSETFAAGRAWGQGVLIAAEIGNRLRGMAATASPCGEAA